MRMHGYCERCRKIKPVHVSNTQMIRLAMNQPIFGLCGSCEEAERQAARDRHPAYRNRKKSV